MRLTMTAASTEWPLALLDTEMGRAAGMQSDITAAPVAVVNNLTAQERELCAEFDEYCRFRIGVDVIVVGTLCFLGLIGNTLAFLTLQADNNNKRVSFMLQAVAVADNLYLLISIFMQPLKTVCDCTLWIPNFKFTFPPLEPWIWPLASIAQMSGVWLVVLVTMDRYLAICHPFHHFRSWLDRHARKGVVIIPLISLLYNIPRFLERKVIVAPERCHNIEKAWAINTALRKDFVYIIVYKTILFFAVRMIIPLLALTVLNIKLIGTLKGARKDRAKLTNQANMKKDSFTPILIAIVTVFILCQVPDFILRIALSVKSFSHLQFKTQYFATITNMLLTLNSSVNVVIYCLTGKRFRRIMKRMLCRICYQRLGGSHYSDDSDNSGTFRSGRFRATFTLVSTLDTGTSTPNNESRM